jgi:peptide-methionine (S)-S-oxide reductase
MISSIKDRSPLVATFLVALAAVAGIAASASPADKAQVIPPPAADEVASGSTSEVAIVAGGCFWGVQGVFQHVAGVNSAISGYDGGTKATAHYDMTSRGDTGHAESVRITFDPSKISYGRILQIFFSVAHDPTQLNRQGPDEGTQYRSAIFPMNDEQARVAKGYIDQLNQAHVFGSPIVTTIEAGHSFFPAESYHQDFLVRNPTYPYIVYNDMPKVENLERLFPGVYRADPVLVGARS